MDPTETQELISRKEPENLISEQKLPNPSEHSDSQSSNLLSIFLQPFQWIKMLSLHLNPSFVFGVFLVYGLSQGFSGSFFKVVTDYYWKDVQKVQPSVVQLYMGFYYIPWVMKPVWGLLTDVFPVKGYKRRPYFIVAGIVGCISALLVGLLGKIPAFVALICLVAVAAGIAIADVTIDACIATNSIKMRSLAPDMQSLCGFCSSAGALVGYLSSGFFVHHLGPQIALALLAFPAILLIVLGFVIHEVRSPTLCKSQKTGEDLGVAVKGMYKTFKFPQVWKPSLYMYLSVALSISTHEGQFYWFTDPKAGPAFSQEFVGVIYAIGAMASIVGVLIYQKTLKHYQFRNLMFFTQLLYGLTGMLDLVFIRRWNLVLGIPDSFFVISEECVSRIVSRIRWMPMIVLSTRLIPSGIEGTFFALLMCIDSFGSLSSKWGGGFVLHMFHVTRTDFGNLWLVILVRNLLRLATLSLIFLVPKADLLDDLIPADVLSADSAVDSGSENDDELQLVPVKVWNENEQV